MANQLGDYIQIGDDSDGLDLIEIKYVDTEKKVGDRILLTEESASLLINALQRILQFRKEMHDKKDE